MFFGLLELLMGLISVSLGCLWNCPPLYLIGGIAVGAGIVMILTEAFLL